MARIEDLKAQREASLAATAGGQPARTTNQFFGVGPITDVTEDEVDARFLNLAFDRWLETTYRKLDDKGNDIGAFTAAELGRSMHRGYPADKILADMMREIHRYFEIPKANKVAVGLGGGHSGFTVCALHLVNANDADQQVFVDTPKPESEAAMAGGFFRQSWGAQLIEMHRHSKTGDPARIHFTDSEGTIPSGDKLAEMGIKLFFGVGHETTGATTYTEEDIRNLIAWIDRDPENHHAVVDATSMLGAMPWPEDLVRQFVSKCCLFTPFQKAIGGVSGYFIASFTPTGPRPGGSQRGQPLLGHRPAAEDRRTARPQAAFERRPHHRARPHLRPGKGPDAGRHHQHLRQPLLCRNHLPPAARGKADRHGQRS